MDVAKNIKELTVWGLQTEMAKKSSVKISLYTSKIMCIPPKRLVLVVVYGFGKNPMLLLTTMEIQETSHRRKSLWYYCYKSFIL